MLSVFRTLVLLLVSISAFAQPQTKDTSFTPYSAFEKARKAYPFISIANPPMPPNAALKKDLVYASVDKRDLHLDVYFPQKSRRPVPAVLLIHAGGWRSGDRSHEIPMARALAAHGYVAVTVEYRLSTEAIYPAGMYDLKAALRWMRAHAREFSIDTMRIAALGCSSGGQMAALLGTTNGYSRLEGAEGNADHSSAVQAVIDIDGILAFIHPESAEGDDSKHTSAATYWFGVSKEQDPALWQEASALNHVDRHTAPMLFINSSLPRFHAGRDDLIKKLDSLHIYSEVHTLPDTPHPFWFFHPWFEPTVNWTVSFLDKVFGKK